MTIHNNSECLSLAGIPAKSLPLWILLVTRGQCYQSFLHV